YRIEAGSFGTLIQQLSLGGTKGVFDYQVSGFHEYSDGVSKAKQTNFGTNALFDTDPYLNLGASGKFGISFIPGLRLGLEGGYRKYTVNYDAGSYQDGAYKEEGNDLSLRARFDQAVLDVWKFKTAYDFHFGSNTFSSGFRHFGMFQNQISLGWNSIDAGIDAYQESTSYVTNAVNAYGLGVSANYGFKAPQWFSATAGGRLDIHKEFGVFLTGRATAAFLAPFGLKAHGSIGTGFKVPSLYQLYAAETYIVGNKKLKPEQSFSLDAGLGYILSNIFVVDAGVFRTEYSNLIDYTFAVPAGTYTNLSSVIAYGFEAEAKVTPVKELVFGVNYTYSVSEDQRETNAAYKQLQRQPKHKGGVFGNLRLFDRLEIHADLSLTGEAWDKSYGPGPFYITTDTTNAGYALVG
ncbi:MAG: TonB-dependent receptor, partial [Spirochaetia bacterium]|nr:TonB-dependent receptor [Spirochaetia bacterium]